MEQACVAHPLATKFEHQAQILIVEDQSELAEKVGETLSTMGYRVQHAVNGSQALAYLRQTQPELLILDWMLPDINGIQILEQFRKTSLAPVLMVSGKANAMDRVLGLELGADDYLAKPFHLAELTARVRALLRRVAHMAHTRQKDRQGLPQPLRHGPLHIDPLAHEVFLREDRVHLTQSEFDLLQLLLKHPGRAFSRPYLLETLWQDALSGCDRSVDNTILKLRKKLVPWSHNLETVWGVGYRLKPEQES